MHMTANIVGHIFANDSRVGHIDTGGDSWIGHIIHTCDVKVGYIYTW